MSEPSPGSNAGTIVLIGLRGSGKSTVGTELAELLHGDFLDTDDLVARESGRSIATLFDEEGEAEFRRRERDAIARALAVRPAVLSVGGGAVLDPRNVELLCSAGNPVWLTASAEVLWERIRSDPATAATRPSLTTHTGLDEVRHLLSEREPHYRKAAALVVDTTDRTPREIAMEIVSGLGIQRTSGRDDAAP